MEHILHLIPPFLKVSYFYFGMRGYAPNHSDMKLRQKKISRAYKTNKIDIIKIAFAIYSVNP